MRERGERFSVPRIHFLVSCQWVKQVAILGSTGSIGTSTLDVIRRNAESFAVYSLVAGRNVELLAQQIAEFRPRVAVVATEADLTRLLDCLRDSGLPPSHWPTLGSGAAARMQATVAPEVHV